MPAIQALIGRLPILGVCLGHQSIGAALGGRIVRAQHQMHGKASVVTTDTMGRWTTDLTVGSQLGYSYEVRPKAGA